MITANNLYKSYGPAMVLGDMSFSLNRGDRVGLVGANGAGKSTLLRVLAGVEPPDSGRVVLDPSLIVGYLPQNVSDLAGQTVDALLTKAAGEIRETETRMHQLEEIISDASEADLAALMTDYEQVSARFNELGSYDVEHMISTTMQGLGIGSLPLTRTVDTLSGGEKTRVGLAAVLLRSPDLLLLDEPTNNLDSQSLQWLEEHLRTHKGAVLIASHDRQFLNAVVNAVMEIDEHTHQLRRYAGNYDDYRSGKLLERAKWEEDYKRQQDEAIHLRAVIKSARRPPSKRRKPSDGDKFVPYFKGQRVQEAASRSIRAAEERLRRIEDHPVPRPPKPMRFRPNMRLQSMRSSVVIAASGIVKSFGAKNVLNDVEFTVVYDSRIVITGPNGSGKSTLLSILAGREAQDSGRVAFAPSVRLGFLPQEPQLDEPGNTVLDHFRRGMVGYDEDFVFDLVTCGLFRYEELGKPATQLSLGQVRKLQIARMIAEEPNVLILDEPTNHVSLDVLESFEAALVDFHGPILSVSHDRRFIRQFGKEVWEIRDGRLNKLQIA